MCAERVPGSIVLLEKEGRVGGNSAKASTGINALTPEKGDTSELFVDDTIKSGQGLSHPDLVETLVVRPLSLEARTRTGRTQSNEGTMK